ncbi:MAG: histidinol dehydrogenase [Bacteroidota bacterium]|jgi:histidinol dehydrogenase
MQVFDEPLKQDWEALLKRPNFEATELLSKVQSILDAVALEGDAALLRLSETFDQVQLKTIAIDPTMIEAAEALVAPALKTAIQSAKVNIEIFHQAQIKKEEKIETMPGVWCWRKSVGIEKVGIYIPGGTAPLFSTVLMLGIPAKLAGCKEVVLCTPPRKDGTVDPAILYAANLVGIQQIYTIGGAQAIAAMAYGTATVPKVFKIFGPGNQYVTAAKQLIQQQGVAIDMPAGPSEVCVYADETAVPAFVAADLLSQAEHGADSQVVLIASHKNIIEQVQLEIELQLANLPRQDFATKALGHSKAIVVALREDAIQLINTYAPEHLILSVDNALVVAEKITNAGSVFIGNYSPESVGDYASGTNHTLPTNGNAKAYSGVSVDSFVKKITFQQLTEMGLKNIAQTVIQMASGEQLEAHAQAVAIRVKDIESKM